MTTTQSRPAVDAAEAPSAGPSETDRSGPVIPPQPSPRPRRRREPRLRPGSRRHAAAEWVLLVLGVLVIAASFHLFLNGNRIATGGVIGLSTLAAARLGVEPALAQWAVNLPLLALGFGMLGRRAGARAAVGTVLLPLAVLLLRGLPTLTHDLVLASVFGGAGAGAGLGLLFRGNGSVGGFSLVALVLRRTTGLPLGTALLLLDGAVLLLAGALLGPERILYGLLSIYVMRRVLDAVLLGLERAHLAFVITERPEEVRRAVLYELERGLTVLEGRGGHTGRPREVLMVALSPTESPALKRLVQQVDPGAFVILADATEVLGQGFKTGAPE